MHSDRCVILRPKDSLQDNFTSDKKYIFQSLYLSERTRTGKKKPTQKSTLNSGEFQTNTFPNDFFRNFSQASFCLDDYKLFLMNYIATSFTNRTNILQT